MSSFEDLVKAKSEVDQCALALKNVREKLRELENKYIIQTNENEMKESGQDEPVPTTRRVKFDSDIYSHLLMKPSSERRGDLSFKLLKSALLEYMTKSNVDDPENVATELAIFLWRARPFLPVPPKIEWKKMSSKKRKISPTISNE
jgi:hypothetical protein